MKLKVCSLVLAGILIAPPVAAAAPVSTSHNHSHQGFKAGAELVTLGDSFTANPANPTVFVSAWGDRDARHRKRVIGASGCIQDPHNWPRILVGFTGQSLADFSCNGIGALPGPNNKSFTYYVNKSIESGYVGTKTQDIIILYGGLDATQWVNTGRNFVTFSPRARSLYLWEMTKTVEKLRAAAPHARITFASYPSVGDEMGRICLVNLTDHLNARVLVLGDPHLEDTMAKTIQTAAKQNNAQFVDLRKYSRAHSTCAEGSQRYVASFFDLTGPYNMPLHPTLLGEQKMAELIYQDLYLNAAHRKSR